MLTDTPRPRAPLQGVAPIDRGQPLDNARQSALFAAAFLAVWFVSVRCQPAMAEDVFLHRPYAGENLAYQSLVAPGDEFTNDATWGSTDVKTTDLNWTQRIARW